MDGKKQPHDGIHHLLFSHHQMVEDLLRHFVRENAHGRSWLEDLDFGSLKRENEKSTDGKNLKKRQRDIVWSIRWRSQPRHEPLYVIILIEFQSRPSWFMALRKLAYLALFYQDHVRAKKLKPGDLLPPVLPVLLYNGERPWQAPVSMAELIGPVPEPLREYQPQYSYLLLDELNMPVELGAERNTVAGLMALERSRTADDVAEASAALDGWLCDPEDEELRQAFALLLQEVLPEELIDPDNPLDLVDTNMQARENLKRWRESYGLEMRDAGRQEGRQEGRLQGQQEGRIQGQQEGQRLLLGRQLRLKFGPLPAEASERLEKASLRQLESWAGRLLTATSLEEIWSKTRR